MAFSRNSISEVLMLDDQFWSSNSSQHINPTLSIGHGDHAAAPLYGHLGILCIYVFVSVHKQV